MASNPPYIIKLESSILEITLIKKLHYQALKKKKIKRTKTKGHPSCILTMYLKSHQKEELVFQL